jgi:hypothetical protein
MQKSLAFVRGFFISSARFVDLPLSRLTALRLREQSYTVWPAFARALRRVSFLVLATARQYAVTAKRKTEM